MFNRDGSSDLSFVVRTDSGPDFWHVSPTGDYATDCQKGRDLAAELQRHMYFGSSPILLKSVAEAIVRKGQFGPIEIGFFHEIGEALLASPHEVTGLATQT